MKRDFFSRKQVVAIIGNLLEHADAVVDAVQNENPANDRE